jgi:predicted phage tail protein
MKAVTVRADPDAGGESGMPDIAPSAAAAADRAAWLQAAVVAVAIEAAWFSPAAARTTAPAPISSARTGYAKGARGSGVTSAAVTPPSSMAVGRVRTLLLRPEFSRYVFL